MKGDYTRVEKDELLSIGEDYPQMKGDYTFIHHFHRRNRERITPR